MGKKKICDNREDEIRLPFISLPNYVVTPLIPQPVKIEEENKCSIIEKAFEKNSFVFFSTWVKLQKEDNEGEIKPLGVVCNIDKVLKMPGAPALIFIRPIKIGRILNFIEDEESLKVDVKVLKQISVPKNFNKDYAPLMSRVDSLFQMIMRFLIDPEKATSEKIVEENSKTPVEHLYALIHVSPISWEEKYEVISCRSFKSLINLVISLLDIAEQRMAIQSNIQERTHQEITRQQKESFLRMHLHHIKEELGETDDNEEVSQLMSMSLGKKWNNSVAEHFNKELNKLRRLNINNPEYSVQYAYLENFLELPWDNYKKSDISLNKVESVLNRDHYGLEKVKERILEYMAVTKLRDDLKAPIICLYGPPGVGKTSIGKSIAEALDREYSRIALGGMHDEAEIRGHRRTYIGAMPGRFLHALSKCEFGNPLMLLDEIDKVGKDYKGDPSSALLEALDPEQNNTFHDNFIDFPYDLSRVLFIATANDLSTIPAPLRDRMEIIEMPGYTLDEKIEIAKKHLIKKALSDNGLENEEVKFSRDALETIIKSFTHEKGVRQLYMAINRILRKLALLKVKNLNFPKEVSSQNILNYLDKKDFKLSSVGFFAG
ncbi:MAG: AAA family ATPase [Muribaculaceae bacterium]|nr:AAA family ATPase [Muribaculaceae bacterium]